MTTTQDFDCLNAWEEETMIAEEFEEYSVDNAVDEYRDVRGKGRDEWKESKRNRDSERKQQRAMKRNWE